MIKKWRISKEDSGKRPRKSQYLQTVLLDFCMLLQHHRGKKSFLQTWEMWPPKETLIVHIGSKKTLIARSLHFIPVSCFWRRCQYTILRALGWLHPPTLHPALATSLLLVSAAAPLGLRKEKYTGEGPRVGNSAAKVAQKNLGDSKGGRQPNFIQ
jgi:hypothetical protein